TLEDVASADNAVGESTMNETEKDRQHLGLEEQCAPDLTGHRFPIAVRVADMPDDLGKLLDIGLEEHFRGR
ncbi:hypothetical protein, partial [Salipiger bermudensis]